MRIIRFPRTPYIRTIRCFLTISGLCIERDRNPVTRLDSIHMLLALAELENRPQSFQPGWAPPRRATCSTTPVSFPYLPSYCTHFMYSAAR